MARPLSAELIVLLALYSVAMVLNDTVDCFLLLSKRSEQALTERVAVIKQIDKALKK